MALDEENSGGEYSTLGMFFLTFIAIFFIAFAGASLLGYFGTPGFTGTVDTVGGIGLTLLAFVVGKAWKASFSVPQEPDASYRLKWVEVQGKIDSVSNDEHGKTKVLCSFNFNGKSYTNIQISFGKDHQFEVG